jgi:hypothetical protein
MWDRSDFAVCMLSQYGTCGEREAQHRQQAERDNFTQQSALRTREACHNGNKMAITMAIIAQVVRIAYSLARALTCSDSCMRMSSRLISAASASSLSVEETAGARLLGSENELRY